LLLLIVSNSIKKNTNTISIILKMLSLFLLPLTLWSSHKNNGKYFFFV